MCLVSIVHNSSVCIILKKKNSYQICYQIVITFSASEITSFYVIRGMQRGIIYHISNKISSYMIHKFKSAIALCPTRQSVKCWECCFMIENLRKFGLSHPDPTPPFLLIKKSSKKTTQCIKIIILYANSALCCSSLTHFKRFPDGSKLIWRANQMQTNKSSV